MLARALAGTTNGFYVDVGAHEPEIDSVTQHFYDQGWRGVNIEPVVRQCQRFVLKRPRDVNLAVAIGRREAVCVFTISRRTDYRPSTPRPRGARTHKVMRATTTMFR